MRFFLTPAPRLPSMPVRLQHPYLLLVLTTLFWSGNMVIGRAIRDQVPPLSLAFWRWAIALTLVLPLALPHLRAQWPLLRRGWKAVVILGLLGVGGYNTLAYIALQYTPATNAVLLNSFIPIATITLSWIFLKNTLRASRASVFCSRSSASRRLSAVARSRPWPGLSLNVGDLWMLAAVFTWALYTIGLQWRPAGVNPMLLLAAFTIVGLLALTPGYAWEIAQGETIRVSAGVLAGIAYTGVFPGFLGYVFYNRAVAEVGASKASLFIHLMPVFGTLLSAIFLDEVPQLYHYVGITLIFAGIYLTTAALPQAKTT
jgi:drug/metabolite transporter (DMT)-like permease